MTKQTSLTRRAWLSATLGALSLSGRAWAQSGAPRLREFRIGYQKSGILVAARQQGSIEAALRAVGVDAVRWVEFQYGPPMMEALGLGSIDFAYVGDTPPIFAQAASARIVYVAATPASPSAILVPPGSPLARLQDLKGKRVAFAKGSSAHNFVVQALAKAGLAYRDIQPTYLNPADAAAAFARCSVDAWAVWDPYYALAERRQNARALATTDGILNTHSFYLAHADFAARHPTVIKAVLADLHRIAVWSAANRDRLAAAISEVTGVELEAQQRAAERAVIELRPITEAVVAQQQSIADTFHGLSLIPRPIRVADAVWTPPQT